MYHGSSGSLNISLGTRILLDAETEWSSEGEERGSARNVRPYATRSVGSDDATFCSWVRPPSRRRTPPGYVPPSSVADERLIAHANIFYRRDDPRDSVRRRCCVQTDRNPAHNHFHRRSLLYKGKVPPPMAILLAQYWGQIFPVAQPVDSRPVQFSRRRRKRRLTRAPSHGMTLSTISVSHGEPERWILESRTSSPPRFSAAA